MSKLRSLRQLRSALSDLPKGGHRRFPPELREALAAYVAARSSSDVSNKKLAAELGVSHPTIAKLRGKVPLRGLVPVQVIAEGAAGSSLVIVRAPGGLVIEGLDVAGMASLIKAMSM